MRDNLCIEKKCRESIELKKEFIEDNRKDIKGLTEDIKNGVKKYPKDNKSIIEATFSINFVYYMQNIRGKYSLGENINALEEDFKNAISNLENIGNEKIGYLNLLWMISLGILLETDKKNIEMLSDLVKKEKIKDGVIDYLLYSCDIGWMKVTDNYYKENPYSKTKEIIDVAHKNKELAFNRLQKYMEKEWFKGHYDYEWKNAHKEPGYVGFWSFETAALAKILGLDDTSLMKNNHYPYDLAHYKNTMKLKEVSLSEYNHDNDSDSKKICKGKEGIEKNLKLEKIIPIKYHSFVNELINDYEVLDDSSFYEKYKKLIRLDRIWFLLEEYKKENKRRSLLGSLIVFAMVEKGYVLQLDYKEDVSECYSRIKNYWNDLEARLIQFVLSNDQNYYALIPKDTSIEKVYEITVVDVKQISI